MCGLFPRTCFCRIDPFVEHRRSHSPQCEETARRSIPLRRILSSRILFTIFIFLFHLFSLPSIQLPYLLSCFTRSRPTTRQSNMIILVHYGLAIRGGLRNYPAGCYIVPSTFKDQPPIILLLNEIPHRIKQVTLRGSLPGSQHLFFPLELEVHPCQPPRTQRARLEDDVHATTTDKDDTTI